MQDISSLSSQLNSESEKNQLKLIPKLIETGESGYQTLMEWMGNCRDRGMSTIPMGKAYQILYKQGTPETKEFILQNFPTGIVPLNSESNIDYITLQKLLAEQDFQQADLVTIQKLCELAGASAVERKWLYFTEVSSIAIADFQTIDKLWLVHSEGKFGFSVQRKIWLALGKDFGQLWEKIDWKKGNSWTRYPNEFTWDLTAPRGHLPLSNQLRGVRVIDAIFKHPAWSVNS
ncbi:MAG: GUN4 N-terminal ARM-like repeat domain-containing protein [Cyanobacteria bacterium P01_F01_bin.143]